MAFHPAKKTVVPEETSAVPTVPVEETPSTLKAESRRTFGSNALPVAETLEEKTVALTEMLGSETEPYSDTVVPCPQPYSPQLMKLSFHPENV